MDIKSLRYFAVTAEFASITKAAQHLRIAQPAVSRQIKKLEVDLGVSLLTRTAQGVSLTSQGNHLLARIAPIIQSLNQARREIQNWGDQPSGPVSVALMPAIGSLIAPRLVQAIRAQYPKIQLRLSEGLSTFIGEGLLSGDFDLGLYPADPDATFLSTVHLLDEPMYLIGPGDEASENHRTVTLENLPKYPLLLPGQPNALRRMINRLATDYGVKLDIRETIDTTSIIKRLVAAGLGYTVQCYSFVHEEVGRGDLSIRPLSIDGLSRNWSLVSIDGRPSGGAVSAVANILQEISADLAKTHHWHPPRK